MIGPRGSRHAQKIEAMHSKQKKLLVADDIATCMQHACLHMMVITVLLTGGHGGHVNNDAANTSKDHSK